MYCVRTLPVEARRALEDLENELDAPIRVLDGESRLAFNLPDWDPAHSGSRDEDDGVTVVIWGGSESPNLQREYEIPNDVFIDGVERSNPVAEMPAPREEWTDCEPLEIGAETYGEIHPRAVYLYLNLWYFASSMEVDYDALLVQPIRASLESSLTEGLAERQRDLALTQLREFYENSSDRLLEQVRERINQNENDARQALSSWREHQSSLHTLQREADALLRAADRPLDERLAEFEKLIEHPRVASLRFSTGTLRIRTTPDIVLRWPEFDQERWLGAFDIRLGLTGAATLELRNLDTRRSNRDHPHVVSGDPCLGYHQALFTRLHCEGEFAALFELLLQYLESFNPADDYGRYASLWFEQPDARPTDAEDTEAILAEATA